MWTSLMRTITAWRGRPPARSLDTEAQLALDRERELEARLDELLQRTPTSYTGVPVADTLGNRNASRRGAS